MKSKAPYQKIWEDNIIYDETVCLIQDENGVKRGRLLFAPTEIISVKDATLTKTFDEKEYLCVGDEIIATENSTLPYFTERNLKGMDLPDGYDLSTYQAKEGEILFTEGPGIVLHQIAVTYRHQGTWEGKLPECKIDSLPHLKETLQTHGTLKVVCYGDSIMTGCNASYRLKIPPYQKDFARLFFQEIKKRHKVKVTLLNKAIGGMLSKGGKENIHHDVICHHPDLVLLNYGMNDGSWKVSEGEYISNMKYMIDEIKKDHPNCEIILISSIIANPESAQHLGQESYYLPLEYLASLYQGVVCMDMTNFTKYLFTKKRGVDILANNINHPSDFLVRQFVSNLLTLIGEDLC